MATTPAPEPRILRIDYELMQLGLPPTTKGEAIERLLKVELEQYVDVAFTKGHIRAQNGEVTAECDLIAYTGETEQEDGRTIVPVENAICVIECKTDLSVSAVEDEINAWIDDVRATASVPVFLVGVRHYNTREELRAVSSAYDTVAFGTLREAGDAEAMAHSNELQRLVGGVLDAIKMMCQASNS